MDGNNISALNPDGRGGEPRHGFTLIRPTRAKSAMKKESIPSFLSRELKDFLYPFISFGFRQYTWVEKAASFSQVER